MTRCCGRILLLCIGYIGTAVSLLGQTGSGELTGRIFDGYGNQIPGVHVTAANESNHLSQQTVTTASGDFLFLQLQPGIYQITLSAPKFKQLDRKGIHVETGQRVRVDLANTPAFAQANGSYGAAAFWESYLNSNGSARSVACASTSLLTYTS